MERSKGEGASTTSPSGRLCAEDDASSYHRMPDIVAVPNSTDCEADDSSPSQTPKDNNMIEGVVAGESKFTDNSNRGSLKNQSVPTSPDAPLDKNARELSQEIDAIFESYDNFGPDRVGEEGETDVFAELSNAYYEEDEDVAHSRPLRQSADATANATSIGAPAGPIQLSSTPHSSSHRRKSSISRRRQPPVGQMESISESGNTGSGQNSNQTAPGGGEDFFDFDNIDLSDNAQNQNDAQPSQQSGGSSSDFIASTSSPFSTPRRRIRASGESRSAGRDSTSRSGGPRTRIRRSRRFLERSNRSANEDDDDDDDTRRRGRGSSSNNNTLVASLDAGMATLRRWIRSRRLSFSSGAGDGGPGSSSGPNSVSSLTTVPLREEDIFALSHTGSDPRRTTTVASSTSSDPHAFDPNASDGFLYYRPFEVHVRPRDLDAESGIYASDDETGTPSVLLHPLVPSNVSSSLDEESSQQSFRQRAHSEPDRVRVRDFLSTVYGTRAIDGGGAQDTAAATGQDSHRVLPTMILEEEADVVDHDIEPPEQQPSLGLQMQQQQVEVDGRRGPSALEAADEPSPPSPLSGNAEVSPEVGSAASDNDLVSVEPNEEGSQGSSAPSDTDPNRRARSRWIQINQRFRCMITSVAILFSLLLFFIVIAWVLFAGTYVIAHKKECDVPIRAYFWLASAQLMLDIFRADIMKWLCRWRTESDRRTPPRVILYNVAYLAYAMLVLRVGVKSVFVPPSNCSDTAPELFYSCLVFVALSLAAWATIILGYLIPFCFVAVLLTRNGYFPNGDITSSRGVMGGRRARVGTGRIGDLVAEAFPNAVSNPAPPGCVDRLRVIMLHEFPDSIQRECCICMMDYSEGEVIVATPCDHYFHKRCCQEWLTLSRTCPVCRLDLPEALGMSEDPSEVQGNLRPEEIRTNLMRYLGRERRQTETTEPRGGTVVVRPGNGEPIESETVGERNAEV